jgi:Mg2+ and Co2+ transporter CorA
MNNCIDNYKDLCTDIEVQQCIINDIENELTILQKLMMNGPRDITGIDYSREPGGQAIHISMDRIIDRINRIERRLEVEKEILEKKLNTKEEINEMMRTLIGLDAKVVFMRDIEKKDLKEIAETLGYSYQYIKEVSAKNKPTINLLIG